MDSRINRREAAIDRMADHVLLEGLAGATLRPLAAAAETSDRMLLYYFADKDELLTAVLQRIAARLRGELDDAIPIKPPRALDVLLDQVWAVLGSPKHKPYMDIWLDLASGATRGLKLHGDVAKTIADGYLAWVTDRLDDGTDRDLALSPALLLVAVQGMYLLSAIGRPSVAADAMIELSRRIQTA